MAGLQKKMIHKASSPFFVLLWESRCGVSGAGMEQGTVGVCAHVHECMCASVSRLRISVCVFLCMWHLMSCSH